MEQGFVDHTWFCEMHQTDTSVHLTTPCFMSCAKDATPNFPL